MTFKNVAVDKIVEYPTTFGGGCHLLDSLGICVYAHTQEKIMHILETSAKDPEKLAICQSGNCGELLKLFRQGITPYNDNDPITLAKFHDKYWVGEGKHRVCIAKRFGIKELQAKTSPLESDFYTLLPPVGSPGVFTATINWYKRKHTVDGEFLYLWADKPCDSYGGAIPIKLNLSHKHESINQWNNVFKGVSYQQNLLPIKQGLLEKILQGNIESLKTSVKIEEHPLVKIWLVRVTVDKYNFPSFKEIEHLYRIGLWRKHHEETLFNSLGIGFTN